MAAQGRRGGATLVAAGALVLLFLLAGAAADGNIINMYIVGDNAGWSKNLEATWLGGKTFYAGDVLVFGYRRDLHDVTVVGAKGYRQCKVTRHSRVMRTGDDAVTLHRGVNYFICGQPGHCQDGMKLAVTAL